MKFWNRLIHLNRGYKMKEGQALMVGWFTQGLIWGMLATIWVFFLGNSEGTVVELSAVSASLLFGSGVMAWATRRALDDAKRDGDPATSVKDELDG